MAANINSVPFNVHFKIGGGGVGGGFKINYFLLKRKLNLPLPTEPETILHLFVDCGKVKEFWQSLQMWLLQNINTRINVLYFHIRGKVN